MALGADPWDPCFYRKAAAQSNHTAGLVQVGRIAVLFPLPLHGAVENCAAFSPTPRASGSGRGCWMRPPLYQSGCADALRCAVRDRSTVLPLLHQRFSFFFGPPSGPFLFLLRLREKEMGGIRTLLQNKTSFVKCSAARRAVFPVFSGGESKRGGRGPLLGRWGWGFQRGRRIGTPSPWRVFPLFLHEQKEGAGLGCISPKENKFALRPREKEMGGANGPLKTKQICSALQKIGNRR